MSKLDHLTFNNCIKVVISARTSCHLIDKLFCFPLLFFQSNVGLFGFAFLKKIQGLLGNIGSTLSVVLLLGDQEKGGWHLVGHFEIDKTELLGVLSLIHKSSSYVLMFYALLGEFCLPSARPNQVKPLVNWDWE